MTLRIAICDDSIADLNALQKYTEQYFREKGNTVRTEIETFSHPDQLLRAAEQRQYQLFLLDILMPMINGINAAKEIQAENPEAFFIFVSTTRDFTFDAFSVKTLHYLTKPVSYADFQAAINRFFLRLDPETSNSILIPEEGGKIIEYPVCRFLYIDTNGKHALLHTTDRGILPIRSSLRNLSDTLASCPMLYKLGASYLINMEAVQMVRGNTVTLKNQERLCIPRRLVGEFRRHFLEYFSVG